MKNNIIDMTCPTPSNEELNPLQTNNIVLSIAKIPDATFKFNQITLPSLSIDVNEVSSSRRSAKF